MSMMKKIEIDGKAVAFKASAAIPRIYRIKFQRDIYKDLSVLEKSIGDGDPEKFSLDLFSLGMRRIQSRLLYRCCCRMYRSTETKFYLDWSNSTWKIISPKTGNKIPYRINS